MRIRFPWEVLVALGVAIGPVVAFAPPRPTSAAPSKVADLAAAVRARGLAGRELVDAAMVAVAEAYPHHSLWHLWKSPARSLRAHRGWSHQYNTVLLLVLRELGVECRLVHAARVRGFSKPWWLAGHTWVKVTLDGREFDACASRTTNRLGDVGFFPLTAELPMRRITRWAVGLALVPFVVVEVWRAWLGHRSVAPWVYGERVDARK